MLPAWHLIGQLGLICNPDGGNRFGRSQLCQRPVIEATTVTQPVAGAVIGEPRHQQYVGRNLLRRLVPWAISAVAQAA